MMLYRMEKLIGMSITTSDGEIGLRALTHGARRVVVVTMRFFLTSQPLVQLRCRELAEKTKRGMNTADFDLHCRVRGFAR